MFLILQETQPHSLLRASALAISIHLIDSFILILHAQNFHQFSAYTASIKIFGVPITAQQRWIWLSSRRMQVWSLASFSGLRIWHWHELCWRLQTWLRSCVAGAVAQASRYSSYLNPSLGTSICHGHGPKKTKIKNNFLWSQNLK